jgi:hypothetical protein
MVSSLAREAVAPTMQQVDTSVRCYPQSNMGMSNVVLSEFMCWTLIEFRPLACRMRMATGVSIKTNRYISSIPYNISIDDVELNISDKITWKRVILVRRNQQSNAIHQPD